MVQSKLLIKYRKAKGLKQFTFAKLVGVTASCISQIENKRRKPSIDIARKIERATKGEITKEELRPDIWR